MELDERARELLKAFRDGLGLDFVAARSPLIVGEHADMRRLPGEVSYDTDALLVGAHGQTPQKPRKPRGE